MLCGKENMNYGIEKKDTIEKLGIQKSSINNILEMKGYSLITEEIRAELLKKLNETETILRKLEKNEFEIAIVGLEKSGKSSFCNALIENALLPTDEQRCTYTSTCIDFRDEDKAVVEFYTEQEFEKDFQDKLKKLGVKNSETYKISYMTESKYQELYEDVDTEKKKLYDASIHQELCDILKYKSELYTSLGHDPISFEGERLNLPEFKDYIVKPCKAMAVKEVRISSSLLSKMPNVRIYDVPGFNSPTEMHRIQTRNKMFSADAIILIANADTPSITADLLKIFKDSDDDGTVLAQKLFVFENKADRSNKLEHNIEQIFYEWQEKYKILSDHSRFFFGSSNARLQSIGKLDPDDTNDYCKSILERLESLSSKHSEIKKNASGENGFGVIALRKALESYNANERFNVLKGRINRYQNELDKLLENILAGIDPDEADEFGNANTAEVMSLLREFKYKAEKELNNYRENHKMEIFRDKPLSNDLVQYIEKYVNSDNYAAFIDEKLDEAKKELNIIVANESGNLSLGKVESKVRDKIFSEMYEKDFITKMNTIVSDFHEENKECILAIIMNALGVKKDSQIYDRIKKEIISDLEAEIDFGLSSNHYQSLIERYSRDIYEILIEESYSPDRYNRFYESIESYFSMSVYYSFKTEPTEKSDIKVIAAEPLVNNRFCHQLLSHNITSKNLEEAKTNAKNYILSHLNLRELSEELVSLIWKVVQTDVMKADEFIANVVDNVIKMGSSNNPINCSADLKNELKNKLASNDNDDNLSKVDIIDKEKFMAVYSLSFKPNRTYADVIQDIRDDIEILRDSLLHCFIRALSLETPYMAKEYIIIEGVKNYIDSDKFDKFLVRNTKYIRSEKFDEIENQKLEHDRNVKCYEEIKKIKDTMNGIIAD